MGCGGSKQAKAVEGDASSKTPKSGGASPTSVVAPAGGTPRVHPPPAAGSSSEPAAASAAQQHFTAKSLKAAARAGLSAVVKLFSVEESVPSGGWAADLSDREAATWLESIQAAVDALWEPLMAKAEARLSAPRAVPAYDSLKPVSLLMLIRGTAALDENSKRWAGAGATTGLLRMGAALWERTQTGGKAPSAEAEAKFVNASLRRLLALLSLALCRTVAVEDASSFETKVQPWKTLLAEFGLARPHLCALLDSAAKGLLLYADAAVRGDAQLRLGCARSSALEDAMPQWEKSPMSTPPKPGGAVSAKLFPRFRNEGAAGWEQGEGHGPRKEFFALAGQQLLHGSGSAALRAAGGAAGGGAAAGDGAAPASSSVAALMPYQPEPRQHWFDARATPTNEAKRLLRFAGWLMGQAVFNRASLQVSVPVLLFRRLLDGASFAPSLQLLEEFDPTAAAGVAKTLQLSDADFAAVIEMEDDDDGAGGGWTRTATREQLAANAARRILEESAGWQFDAVAHGFAAALPASMLRGVLLSGRQLAEAVCGAAAAGAAASTVDFSIRSVFRVVEEDDLRECVPLRDALWHVLEGWAPAKKRALVRFVTGSERLPAPGTELFWVQMPFVAFSREETMAEGGKLPQAHTCDNILELPNYYAALRAKRGLPEGGRADASLLRELRQVVQQRFETAVTECGSYGLDDGAEHAAGSGWQTGALDLEEAATDLDGAGRMADGGRHAAAHHAAADGPSGGVLGGSRLGDDVFLEAERRAEEARAAADHEASLAIPSLESDDVDLLALEVLGDDTTPEQPNKAWRFSSLARESHASSDADGSATGAAGGGGAPTGNDDQTSATTTIIRRPPAAMTRPSSDDDVDALLQELDDELECDEL